MRNLCLVLLVILASFASRSPAQIINVGPGSTVGGDQLRGEGIYLQGLGSWELNNAKAMQLNAETMKKIADWNQQYYDVLRRDWNDRLARQNADLRKRAEAERLRQARLRTNPTSDDISRGDALNALLIDLANPSIQESSWRGAKIPLPAELSLRGLAFRFAEKANTKGSQSLNGRVIALGRLDMAGHWPGYLPEDIIGPERAAYEASYKKLSDACEKGQPIITLSLALDKEIERLKNRAAVVIPPEKGYRTAATQYVAGLSEAARAFQADTMDFASDYIADAHRHKAETVDDLLSFMRKYRLYFAPADKNPDTVAAYDTVYRLLKLQSDALGVKPEQAQEIGEKDKHEQTFKAMQGIWHGSMHVTDGVDISADVRRENWTTERRGDRFVTKKNGIFQNSGTFDIDTSKTPMVLINSIEEGEGAGKVRRAIFRIDGQTMTACIGDPLPEVFESLAGQGRMLLVFTRGRSR